MSITLISQMQSTQTSQEQEKLVKQAQDETELEYRKKYEAWYNWGAEKRVIFEGDLSSIPEELLKKLDSDIDSTLESLQLSIDHYTHLIESFNSYQIEDKNFYDAKKRGAILKKRWIVAFRKKVTTILQEKKRIQRNPTQQQLLLTKHQEFKESCLKGNIMQLFGKNTYKAISELADLQASKTLKNWANQTKMATPDEVDQVDAKIIKSRLIRVNHCGYESIEDLLSANLPSLLLNAYKIIQNESSCLGENNESQKQEAPQ